MPDTGSVFDRLTFRSDGVIYLRPCLDVIAYWTGSAFDRVDGILNFYRKSLGLVGDTLTFHQTDTMGKAAPLKKDSLDLVPYWLSKTKSRRDVYMLLLESGASADEISDRAIAFQAVECGEESSGYIRLVLPVAVAAEAAVGQFSLVDIARDLFEGFEFNFGQAGYALTWNELGRFPEKATETMGAIRKRYPGLDLSDPGSSQYVASGAYKCVNWLTMIGTAACERLGGAGALRDRMGPEIVVHELSHGLMIQAGSMPEIGDTNRRRSVPLYHRVGRALAPIRDPDHPAFLTVDGADDEDATNEWLGRFDR